LLRRSESAVAAFLGSLFLTLGNPKVMIFFLSIMPLVIRPEDIAFLVGIGTRVDHRHRDFIDHDGICSAGEPGTDACSGLEGPSARFRRRMPGSLQARPS